jgi:hypothetical protein
MNKRGAITLFIIVGMIFLILFSFAIYFQDFIKPSVELKKVQNVPNELKPIYNYITSCVEQSTREAVKLNAMQGGFKEIRRDENGGLISMQLTYTFDDFSEFFYVPFYVYSAKSYIPENLEINSQLSKQIENLVYDCIEPSKLEENLNKEITGNLNFVEVNSELLQQSVLVKLIYPVEVNVGETTQEWSLFEVEVPTVFPELYSAAREYSLSQIENENYLCLSCIQDIADKYNLFINHIEMEDYGNIVEDLDEEGNLLGYEAFADHTAQIIYSFIKEEPSGENMTFMVVHQFDIENEYEEILTIQEEGVQDPIDDKPNDVLNVKLSPIPKQTGEVGYSFSYQVESIASLEEIQFYEDSDLFNIDETGLIEFIPAITDVGHYSIIIGVMDDQDNFDTETMLLTILKPTNTPTIEYIDYQYAYPGELFSFQVDAESIDNTTLTYYDDTDLFDIDAMTGIIGFIPKEINVGEHNIQISVVDEDGIMASQTMELIIEEEAYKELE